MELKEEDSVVTLAVGEFTELTELYLHSAFKYLISKTLVPHVLIVEATRDCKTDLI